MKEYGGYIEFENYHGMILHEEALALNSGRGALEYLCEAKKIKKLYLPYFLCSSVPNLCKKIRVEYRCYHINLTENLLRGIDYASIAKRRQENFEFLNAELWNINELKLKSVYGAFMYPLLIKNGAVMRKELQKEKIYIPTLWPNVMEECPSNSLEYHYAVDILPIPVDQWYGIEEMNYLVEVIKGVSSERA